MVMQEMGQWAISTKGEAVEGLAALPLGQPAVPRVVVAGSEYQHIPPCSSVLTQAWIFQGFAGSQEAGAGMAKASRVWAVTEAAPGDRGRRQTTE